MSKPPTTPAGPPTTPSPKLPAHAAAGTPAPDASPHRFKLFAEIFGASVVAVSAISMVYDFFFSDRFSFIKRDKVQAAQKVQVLEKIEATTEKVPEVVTIKEQKGPEIGIPQKGKEEEDINLYEAKTNELEETFLVCPEWHEEEEPCPEKKRSFENECPAEAE